MRAFAAQYRTELALSLRNGEQLLVNLFIPLGLLVFFSKVKVLNDGADPIQFLAPAVLALAVMSSALVSLGISTGFERFYGVLKRLGATPLGRPRWVAAKFACVLTIELGQWVVLIAVGLALGWSPGSGWLPAVAGAVLGTAAFGGLSLLMAGTLGGMTNLAACNGLYLALMVTGGMVVQFSKMPGPLQAVAKVLPAAPLADVMIGSLQAGKHVHTGSWIVLAAWALITPVLAARLFNWD
ncbi:MAG: ABC transporter permease [Acidimicrobiales bacterium]